MDKIVAFANIASQRLRIYLSQLPESSGAYFYFDAHK